jgi:hypothetical protein
MSFRLAFPKNVEILKPDTLANRKLPIWCARCKTKSWREKRKENVSVSRIRALLEEGKRDRVIHLLSLISDKKKAIIMKHLEEGRKGCKKYSPEESTELLREVLWISRKKEQNLETFKPLS